MIGRVLERLRGFHRDRNAQILPLVFFLGIAFFTGTVLVLNTGRTVTHRIEAQNAVDAASVSGATAIARGMNYISSNNISMAKLLASIVIIRSFQPAIDKSRIALKVWRGIAAGMIAAGNALIATLFGAGAGAALVLAGNFLLNVKIPQEEYCLQALENIVKPLAQFWDNNGSGIAWIALKVLAKLGDGLAYISPLIAQYTAKVVFRENLAGSSGWTDTWMLPLYPRMPACKGKIDDFVDPVTGYVEKWEKPIIVAGWLVLTLSGFPLFYEAQTRAELKKLFTGSGTAADVDDPDAKALEEKGKELDELKDELKALEAERKRILEQRAAVEDHKMPPYHDLPTDETDLKNLDFQNWLAITAKQGEINDKQQEIKAITDKRQTGGPPPAGHPPPIKDPLGGGTVKENKDVYPYKIEGKDWPKSFTYFTLAWSDIPTPDVPLVFENPYGKSVVYAAARVVNPVKADLWTPAWRARLVRARGSDVPTNPIGKLPAACGEEPTEDPASGDVPDDGGADPGGEDKKGTLEKLLGLLSKH